MEIAYSFLRLINKATKHVYHGEMLNMARTGFTMLKPSRKTREENQEALKTVQHRWLFKFKEGLSIRSEILRFYRNFFVFSLNH